MVTTTPVSCRSAALSRGAVSLCRIADLAVGGEPIRGLGYFAECETFLRGKGYVFDAEYLRQLYRASGTTGREAWFRAARSGPLTSFGR